MLPLLFFSIYQKQTAANSLEAVLRIDGEEIRRFNLVVDQKTFTYRYEDTDGDYNIIEITDQKIRVREASCRDQVCVRRGWIEKKGDTIVCLPHKLVIEIV
ncbi:hypothetical protein RV10_GL004063 [Enterococcus pallens]|nr:hypothetical protein RV10_GL004063 [Enterococcus pallens]